MFRSMAYLLASCCALSCMCGPARGQNPDKPQALLRQEPDKDRYFIIVRTYAPLPQNSTVSAALANKEKLVSWEGDVKDCGAAGAGTFCKQLDGNGRIELRYDPALPLQESDKYKVTFAIADAQGKGSFRAVDVTPDYKVGAPRSATACHDGLTVDLNADVAAGSGPEEWRFLNARIKSIGSWLGPLIKNPSGLALIQVEPMKSRNADVGHPRVTSFDVFPSVMTLESKKLSDEPDSRISICMHFDAPLPRDKFNVEIAFQNSPPMELVKKLDVSVTGAAAMKAPDATAVVGDSKLGLRALDDNLDLGFVLTSSVKNEKKEDKTVRGRSTKSTLDLRLAPFLRSRVARTRAGTWQPFWTPAFIDAKVSNGKIDDDTLSLNRILFGTELTFKYYQSTQAGKRNNYLITLRGVNASDRDYKRAEIKGELEIRPIFDKLNRPLIKSPSTFIPSVILPDGSPREVTNPRVFGYQIQPFFGVEAGRMYRNRRPVLKGEELSNTVRRFYFGADMAFDLTARLKLSFTDMLYVRGESPDDRLHNYFNGKIEVPLGNLSRRVGQSIFFSFERGNQPPFATPNVNSLKLGYRIKSDFFRLGAAP